MLSTPCTYTSPDDPAREDEGLFGPGSVTWRVMSSRIMWVAIVRALYLQALHPRVIRGTLQNAATITQPVDAWARLRRTRKFIETHTFGTTAEAERAGRHVRKIHESLTGTDPDGTRYRVDEPELLLWVHCGEVASCADIARRSRLPFLAPTRRGKRRPAPWPASAHLPSLASPCRRATPFGNHVSGLFTDHWTAEEPGEDRRDAGRAARPHQVTAVPGRVMSCSAYRRRDDPVVDMRGEVLTASTSAPRSAGAFRALPARRQAR